MSTLCDLVIVESFETMMERDGHLMPELDFFSVEDAQLQFRSIILAYMKMEAKVLQINLQSLYIYEEDMYMSSCLPEYIQSPFMASAEKFKPAEDPATDACLSHPKTSSPKKPTGEGEPTSEGTCTGEPNLSPSADQSG